MQSIGSPKQQVGTLANNLPALVREKQLRKDFLPVGHSTVWAWVANGTFPPPTKLSSGVTAWKRSDLEAWANGTWVPGLQTAEGASHA